MDIDDRERLPSCFDRLATSVTSTLIAAKKACLFDSGQIASGELSGPTHTHTHARTDGQL